MEGSAYANRQNLTRSIEGILSIDLISSLAEGRCQWHTELLKEEQEAAGRGKSHRDKDAESQQQANTTAWWAFVFHADCNLRAQPTPPIIPLKVCVHY